MQDGALLSVLVTGANGLIGRSLCLALDEAGYSLIRAVRHSSTLGEYTVGDINGTTDWSNPLYHSPQAVVHLAARVHEMRERDFADEALCRQVNTEGTLNLARQCAASGVKRFVFLSTVKVLGEGGQEPYHSADPADPVGPYAISKWEAEQGLREIATETGLEVVVLRPPLVYGPGVKANFLRLMRAVDKGIPLPFGAIHNRRSFVYLGNLTDVILVCLAHPIAAGKTYLLSDGEDISTPELIHRIATALDRPARLLPVPRDWMRFLGKLLGELTAVDRLLGSLAVDSQPIQDELGWTPPFSMQTGLAVTVDWYQKVKSIRDVTSI
ncbi:MAG: SDR family oxidoreductase [Gammaproteobacteria bacterium]|nr:SDR family oxidoreductase [Gammaproteobacteria bacterium]